MDPNFRTGLALLVLGVSLVLLVLVMMGAAFLQGRVVCMELNEHQFSGVQRGVVMFPAPYQERKMSPDKTPEQRAKGVVSYLRSKPDPGAGAEQGWGGTVGQHWTTKRSVADTFSHPRDSGGIGAILHAQHPEQHHVMDSNNKKAIRADLESENEVSFRSDAPVHITGVTFPGHGNTEDVHVPFDKPVKFRAGNTGR